MLDVGISEYKTAFKKYNCNYCSVNIDHPYECLLLFYAVECGLKAYILKRKKLPNSSKIKNVLNTHNLNNLLKEIRINKTISPSFRLQRDKSSHSTEIAHQAWRYGVSLVEGDQQRLRKELHEIREIIKKRI